MMEHIVCSCDILLHLGKVTEVDQLHLDLGLHPKPAFTGWAAECEEKSTVREEEPGGTFVLDSLELLWWLHVHEHVSE